MMHAPRALATLATLAALLWALLFGGVESIEHDYDPYA